MSEHIIHIQWDGPYSISKINCLDDWSKDRGLYQIYAHHPVYGSGQLVYIGQTCERTFFRRISEERFGSGSENDPKNVSVYVGRLKGKATPSDDVWRKEILLAEMLLIHSHAPAYNSTHMMYINEANSEVRDVRILNWGCVRALHREVSGLMWTTATRQFDDYQCYVAPPRAPGSRDM